jgi:hypothetical protein
MNADRKADLQRKLTLVSVPKPPSGLAERIKRDIPARFQLNAEQDRQRLSRSVAFSFRVAASVLLVISAAYLSLQLLSRVDQQEQPAVVTAPRRHPSPNAAPPAAVAVAAEDRSTAPRKDEPKLARRKAKPQAVVAEAEKRQLPKSQEQAVGAVAQAPPPPASAAAAESVPMARAAKVVALTASGVDQRDAAASLDRFAPGEAVPAHEVRLEQEITTSPVSGKQMLRISVDRGAEISDVTLSMVGARRVAAGSRTSVYEMEAPSAAIGAHYRQNGVEKSIQRSVRNVVPWSSASRRTKAAVLAAEWERGGDASLIARLAREAGLDQLADSVEKR